MWEIIYIFESLLKTSFIKATQKKIKINLIGDFNYFSNIKHTFLTDLSVKLFSNTTEHH